MVEAVVMEPSPSRSSAVAVEVAGALGTCPGDPEMLPPRDLPVAVRSRTPPRLVHRLERGEDAWVTGAAPPPASGPLEAAERAAHRVEERVGDLARALKPRLRGVLHEAAFAVSLITGTALVCLAEGGRARTAAVIYAVSVALLFGTSSAYHRGTWSPRSYELMKRL